VTEDSASRSIDTVLALADTLSDETDGSLATCGARSTDRHATKGVRRMDPCCILGALSPWSTDSWLDGQRQQGLGTRWAGRLRV